MSSSWTEQILAEARAIGPDDFLEPKQDVAEGEHPSGTAPILARQLWTLAHRLQRESIETLVESEYGNVSKERRAELENLSKSLQGRAKRIRSIFWAEVESHLGMFERDAMGVRTGWVIVWSEQKPDLAPNFLRGLFGGGAK